MTSAVANCLFRVSDQRLRFIYGRCYRSVRVVEMRHRITGGSLNGKLCKGCAAVAAVGLLDSAIASLEASVQHT